MCGRPLGAAPPPPGASPSLPSPAQKRRTEYDPSPAPVVAAPPPVPPPSAPVSPAAKRRTEYEPGPGPRPPASEPDPFASRSTRAPLDPKDPWASSFPAAPAPTPPPPASTPRAAAAAPSQQVRGVLVEYRSPADAGRVHALVAGRNKLGRDDDRDVVLEDERVSGEHAFISIADDRARFVDASSNGSMVDGQRVFGDAVDLTSGAVLTLGGTRLVFLLVPVSATRAAP